MRNLLRVWGSLWLWTVCGATLCAQSFRRVTDVNDLEPGAHYVLAGYCSDTPDQVFVMSRQQQTGTTLTAGEAHKEKPDAEGRIQVDDGRTAVFELVQEGTYFAFRETALNAWLAYSTLATSTASASLYLLTDSELDKAPATSKKSWHKTFKLQDPGKTFFLTTEEITFGARRLQGFLFVDNGMSYSSQFKLYGLDNYGDSLFIYKELQAPAVDRTEEGDWTFRGDWQGDALYGLDYTAARRIDFTGISLPQAGTAMPEGGKQPEAFVWTYVRQGEAGRLPDGWPNVIEVADRDGETPGRAATRIWGTDEGVLGPKYPFEVAAGKGIAWCREVEDDGGWSTVGLPFAVESVMWDSPEGEPLELERYAFESFASGGAVFRELEPHAAWEAGTAYLWRPVSVRGTRACFYAEEGVVQADEPVINGQPGFHATASRLDITGGEGHVFLLADDGQRFVRAASGSWIAPGRGYLVCPASASPSVRWMESDATVGQTDLRVTSVRHPVPVYGWDGRCMGWTDEEGSLPEDWPAGIYLTPCGKIWKR